VIEESKPLPGNSNHSKRLGDTPYIYIFLTLIRLFLFIGIEGLNQTVALVPQEAFRSFRIPSRL